MTKTSGVARGAARAVGPLALIACVGVGCGGDVKSSRPANGTGPTGGSSSGGGNAGAQAASAGVAGGGAGALTTGGDETGGADAGGSGGAPMGGAPMGGAAGDAPEGDPTKGETPPWRELGISVEPNEHVHKYQPPIPGSNSAVSAGLDNRAATMAGKLIVNLGLTEGVYEAYLGKRGFHVLGVRGWPCEYEPGPQATDRDVDGNCALNELDGLPHGDANNVSPEQSVMAQVLTGLQTLERDFPGEGWGYFLTRKMDAVRWSDVGLTGYALGGNIAAIFGHVLYVYRVVSASGPGDDRCGLPPTDQDFDPSHLPYDPSCPLASISSWLDAPSITPIDRYFGFSGRRDSHFGDYLFAMERMHYVGSPVNIGTAQTPYGGSHRFYADAGHASFPLGFSMDAINIAFGVLPENMNPTF